MYKIQNNYVSNPSNTISKMQRKEVDKILESRIKIMYVYLTILATALFGTISFLFKCIIQQEQLELNSNSFLNIIVLFSFLISLFIINIISTLNSILHDSKLRKPMNPITYIDVKSTNKAYDAVWSTIKYSIIMAICFVPFTNILSEPLFFLINLINGFWFAVPITLFFIFKQKYRYNWPLYILSFTPLFFWINKTLFDVCNMQSDITISLEWISFENLGMWITFISFALYMMGRVWAIHSAKHDILTEIQFENEDVIDIDSNWYIDVSKDENGGVFSISCPHGILGGSLYKAYLNDDFTLSKKEKIKDIPYVPKNKKLYIRATFFDFHSNVFVDIERFDYAKTSFMVNNSNRNGELELLEQKTQMTLKSWIYYLCK